MTTFPAITLWQPYASLIFTGDKRHETRSFRLPRKHWNQWVAIHAAKRQPELKVGLDPLARRSLGQDYFRHAPRGAVLGIVLFGEPEVTDGFHPVAPSSLCGDYSPGRYLWPVRRYCALVKPIPMRGRQGWFTVDLPLPAPPVEGTLI
jgi:hypothetical protein